MVDTEDTSPAAGAAATDNTPNGGKTTAAGATATAPKQPAQKSTSITAAGVQKAVPTGSPTLDNSDTLPTLNPDVVPDDDSDTNSETVSLHDVGGRLTIIPGPLTTEIYTTTIPGGTGISVVTVTTHAPSMTVPASTLQSNLPGGSGVPGGVVAGIVAAFLVVVGGLGGWFYVGWRRRRRRRRDGHLLLGEGDARIARGSVGGGSSGGRDVEKSEGGVREVAELGKAPKEVVFPAPVEEEPKDPFADDTLENPNSVQPPLSALAPRVSPNQSRAITRKHPPEQLFLPPTLPIADMESIFPTASGSETPGSSGTSTPRRRKHVSLNLFPAPPRGLTTGSRPGTPTSITTSEHAISMSADTLLIQRQEHGVARAFTPPPPIRTPFGGDSLLATGYSSDPETRRRSLRAGIPVPRIFSRSPVAASTSGTSTTTRKHDRRESSFEPRLNLTNSANGDPFADPVRRPWPTPRPRGPPRSATPPVPSRNEVDRQPWYVTPPKGPAGRTRHGKRGSIFREDIE